MRARRWAAVALVVTFATACPGGGTDAGPTGDGGVAHDSGILDDAGTPDSGEPDDAGSSQDAGAPDDGGHDDAGDSGPLYVSVLEDESDLLVLAGEGGEVKYLAAIADAGVEPPFDEGCAFQNMQVTPWHFEFLLHFDAYQDLTYQDYVSMVLRRATRVWWGGAVKLYPDVVHPLSGESGVLAYSIYAETTLGNLLEVDDIVEVDAIMRDCAPFANEMLAFIPSDMSQRALAISAEDDLGAMGIAVLLP